MKKNKSERPFVGDIIITNRTFKPKKKDGTPSEFINEPYRGIVVSRKGNNFGVRYGVGLDFTDHLNGLLSNPIGCMLERDEFEIESDI